MLKISVYGVGNFGFALLKHLSRKQAIRKNFTLYGYDINKQLVDCLRTKRTHPLHHKNINLNKDAIAERLLDESLFSVDIVEYLVGKGLSYRKAHDITGKMVKDNLDKNRKISGLSIAELKRYSPLFDKKVKKYLNAWASVSRKTSYGGTSPRLVKAQLKKWRGKLNA